METFNQIPLDPCPVSAQATDSGTGNAKVCDAETKVKVEVSVRDHSVGSPNKRISYSRDLLLMIRSHHKYSGFEPAEHGFPSLLRGANSKPIAHDHLKRFESRKKPQENTKSVKKQCVATANSSESPKYETTPQYLMSFVLPSACHTTIRQSTLQLQKTVSKATRFSSGTGGTPIFGPPSFGGQWGHSNAQSEPSSGPVELRNNDWKPSKDTNAPKAIEEVRKEAYRQEMEERRRINNLPPVQNNYGGGGSRLPGSQPQKKGAGDWTTVSKASRFQTGPKKSEPVGTGGTPIFGPPSFGGQWGQSKAQSRPPSGPSQQSRPPHEVPPRFLNSVQNLSLDDSLRSSNKGSRNSAPGPSGFHKLIPPMFPSHQLHALPLLPATSPPMSSNPSVAISRSLSLKDNSDSFTADTRQTVKNIFQEYLCYHKLYSDDTVYWIKSRFEGDKMKEFVYEIARQVCENSNEWEQKSAGRLLRLLIKTKEISREEIIRTLALGVMQDLPDIMIDVPKATSYLAQFLVEMFYEESNLNWLVDVGDRLIHNEDCGESAWNELAVNSLNLLKLRHNEELVRTSFRKTERRDVIPVDLIPWLQDNTVYSLADHMVKVLNAKLNPGNAEEIEQVFQKHRWDVRDEVTIRALTEAICMLAWNPEAATWRNESLIKLLPLLSLPNQKMFPIVWKQVEDFLRKQSIDIKKGERLWSIMYSLNMTMTQ